MSVACPASVTAVEFCPAGSTAGGHGANSRHACAGPGGLLRRLRYVGREQVILATPHVSLRIPRSRADLSHGQSSTPIKGIHLKRRYKPGPISLHHISSWADSRAQPSSTRTSFRCQLQLLRLFACLRVFICMLLVSRCMDGLIERSPQKDVPKKEVYCVKRAAGHPSISPTEPLHSLQIRLTHSLIPPSIGELRRGKEIVNSRVPRISSSLRGTDSCACALKSTGQSGIYRLSYVHTYIYLHIHTYLHLYIAE